MATDWSARTAAIEYFEQAVRDLKRVNDDSKELYVQALNALRRSQDHTAIQNKLNEAMKVIRLIAEMPASTHDIDKQLCQEFLATRS
jgi:predicted ATPase